MSVARDDVARRARQFQQYYEAHEQTLSTFLETCVVENPKSVLPNLRSTKHTSIYMNQLQDIANRREKTMHIFLDDISTITQQLVTPDESRPSMRLTFDGRSIVSAILTNTQLYLKMLKELLATKLPDPDGDIEPNYEGSATDILIQRRKIVPESDALGLEVIRSHVPPQLLSDMHVILIPPSVMMTRPVRGLGAEDVGRLVSIDAIVVRVGSVRPRIEVATYCCTQCECELYQMCDNVAAFTPVVECPTQSCKSNKLSGALRMYYRTSKFQKCQEIAVQEAALQVPVGSIPLNQTIMALGDLTRKCLPGDSINVSGVYLPKPRAGFQALVKGLNQDMYIVAHSISVIAAPRSAGSPVLSSTVATSGESHSTSTIIRPISQILGVDPKAHLRRLADSLYPELYGLWYVKQAMILMLLGGTTVAREGGVKIRGDMHMLLMGDPGVAKSQLLRRVVQLTRRGVYTSGRGTSGAGLTACVVRDSVTNELSLEGGALVMADRGICAIDEFDKMDESDRTSIHEVMEQQTVSIAKSGITTSLNARTCVLAAANPMYGRYDPKKSPLANINLPHALLSRFDLIFLLLDNPEYESDLLLAEHIVTVHGAQDSNKETKVPLLTDDEFRHFISMARDKQPILSPDLHESIAGEYVSMRARERAEPFDERKSYTMPRQLLSLIRLSQAVAKARLSGVVERYDYEEALKLVKYARDSFSTARNDDKSSAEQDLWRTISETMKSNTGDDGWVSLSVIEEIIRQSMLSINDMKSVSFVLKYLKKISLDT